MNLKTGEIRQLAAGEKGTANEVELQRAPNPKCKKCFGKGYTGRWRDTGEVVLCSCVTKKE